MADMMAESREAAARYREERKATGLKVTKSPFERLAGEALRPSVFRGGGGREAAPLPDRDNGRRVRFEGRSPERV